MSSEIIDWNRVEPGKPWDESSEVDLSRPKDFLFCKIFGKMYEGKRNNCPYCLAYMREKGKGNYDMLMHEPYKVRQDENKKGKAVNTPSIVTEEFIAEEIYSPGNEPAFLKRDFGSDFIERIVEIEYHGITYRPLDNDTLRKRLIILPSEAEPCTFKKAFDKGCELALQMYDAEEDRQNEIKHLVAVSQASFYLDRFTPNPKLNIPGMGSFAPIIAARGGSGSGKDRLLNALRLNSYKPFFDVSTRRIPSLFRPINDWGGTLCLSEMDFSVGDETSELVHYLNCRSYGVPISRQNPDSVRKNEVFSNFGLTIVTQRRAWTDNATESRTLPFYCEKSQKPLASEELDLWIDEGIRQQNRLIYLRLMNWDKITIDKAARVEGITDHRLTASVLPLLAIGKHEPIFISHLKEVLLTFERRRKEVAANSRDGIVINHLWDRLSEGAVGVHNGILWVGKKNEAGEITPLTTSDMAEELRWSARDVRSVLNSLQLHKNDLPTTARIGGKLFKPIWFEPRRMEGRLLDFVPDYEPKELFTRIESVTSVTSVTEPQRLVTDVTDVTDVVPVDSKVRPAYSNKVLELWNQPEAKNGLRLGHDFEHAPEELRAALKNQAKFGDIYEFRPGEWKFLRKEEGENDD